MNRKLIAFMLLFLCSALYSKGENIPTIYIDKNGVMRWNDTREEASFYGVNYTLPFAHVYRAMNYLGKDHKEAIDKDVYHFSRLGFNAYRIHIWDVEISDGEGNLIENDHLDLFDYLVAKLKERDIRILITTMTNFGNGYPERNQNTGAFSYLYEKGKVHSNPKAIEAQKRYIAQFITHVNPYTKQSYKDDPYIIGFEINNEPFHTDSPKQTEEYINSMLKAIKKTGNKKPVFYNVSHNMEHTQAYYNTTVQGTTYQWYPIGLVAGRTRKGNFLPSVDQYNIPFSKLKGFDKKVKAVYEYDPADITYSYIHPAMVRTFRSQGFQWITQFAYDPIDMAWANSEYQTHFLNLAYTPNKAVSLAIAAEVAYRIPKDKQFPKYPNDTIFDHFRVSYTQDLSELNSPYKFYYSDNTSTHPIAANQLNKIIGCGSSPIVRYEGTGAYFIDQLEDGVWRLEVMPDAIQINDPFATPSLQKEVVTIAWNSWSMQLNLPDLGKNFTFSGINKDNLIQGQANDQTIVVKPGVYLLKRNGHTSAQSWEATTRWNNILLGEYVTPQAHADKFSVVHSAAKVLERGSDLHFQAQIIGPATPDSVMIYTDKISFWADHNPYILMKRKHGYTYEAVIPNSTIGEDNTLRYNIVLASKGENWTYPAQVKGHPLDWDFYKKEYWETKIVDPNSKINLFCASDNQMDTYGIPETSYVKQTEKEQAIAYQFEIKDEDARFYWRKYIKDDIELRKEKLAKAKYLNLKLKDKKDIDRLKIGFVTNTGFTYTTIVDLNKGNNNTYQIALDQLRQDLTTLLPAPYPSFLERYFEPDTQIPFNLEDIEMLEISTTDNLASNASIDIESLWIE